MKENKISIEINRPVSEVFEFTINPENTHLWIDSIEKEETNEWPAKVGTVYRSMNKQGEWSEYKLIKFVPDKVFIMKRKNSSYHVKYTYEKISERKTRLIYFEWVETGELEGLFTLEVLEKLKSVMESK